MCLQALSEEEFSGHCHGSSDNPEVCRCGYPGLSEGTPSPSPFFPVIFLLKQKQKPIFNIYYQNSVLKNALSEV